MDILDFLIWPIFGPLPPDYTYYEPSEELSDFVSDCVSFFVVLLGVVEEVEEEELVEEGVVEVVELVVLVVGGVKPGMHASVVTTSIKHTMPSNTIAPMFFFMTIFKPAAKLKYSKWNV